MAPPLKTLQARDFSGGLNLRDSPPQLGKDEFVDAWNVTLDERGAVSSRLGMARWNSTAFSDGGGGVIKNVYYSPFLGQIITQAGDDLYLGTTNTTRLDFTTAARVVFADFAGKVYCAHPVDGLYHTTDGITWTSLVDADLPDTISALAVWQNKLWAAVDNRLFWSSAGDGTAWAAADFNTLREKDDEPIVALLGAPGLDVIGRPGLLAFKRRSVYRVHDSSTGAYVTVDSRVGAASNISVAALNGRVYALSDQGIWSTDGTGRMRNDGARLERLWRPAEVNLAQQDLFAAGVRGNRLHFSVPRAGSSANDLAIEMRPAQADGERTWIVAGSNAMSCYTAYLEDTVKLYGGHPSTSGRVYELYTGGTDDADAIVSRFQTRWFEPEGGFETQVWRVRLHGRGTGQVAVLLDYSSGGTSQAFSIGNDPIQYDAGVLYDTGASYSDPVVLAEHDIYTPGRARAYSIKITATTTDTAEAIALLGGSVVAQNGSWALYGVDLAFVPFTPA